MNNRKSSNPAFTAAIAGLVAVLVVLLIAFMLLVIKMNNDSKVDKKNSDTKVVTENKEEKVPDEENKGDADETPNKEEPSEVEEPPATTPVTMYIAHVENSVYFRSQPVEDSSNIMGTIPVGTQISFLENDGAIFAKIKYNGQEGYVKREYLSSSKPQKNTTVTDNSIKSYKYVANVENSIYLRSSASSSGGIITTIPVGTQVGFISVANSEFSKISYNGTIGYSKSKFLEDYYTAPASSSSGNYMTVCNVKYAIYLRSQPSSNGSIICEIPVNSKVKFLDYGNGTFYKISWNGQVGYSKSEYLSW